MGTSLVSNPPYNMPWKIPELVRFLGAYSGAYAIPPKNNANYAFVLSALHLIDDKAAVLLPNGVLVAGTKEEKLIIRQLVEDNLISAVITLPDSMFESTSIPVCILLFDRHKQTRKIEMIDMRSTYETEVRDQRGQFGGSSHTGRTYHKEVKVLTAEGMEKAIKAIRTLSDEQGFCRAVLPEAVIENDLVLNPSRYIEQEEVQERHRSFEDIAADYNRIIRAKNQIRIRMNKTAAKRLGYDCLDHEAIDLTASFAIAGQTVEKENFIRFSADDGIEIKCSTKDGIPDLIIMFLNQWKQFVMHWNNEENRYLAEFRDALLSKLMNGEIEIETDL